VALTRSIVTNWVQKGLGNVDCLTVLGLTWVIKVKRINPTLGRPVMHSKCINRCSMD
jgi:hypothetical protein